MIRNLGIKALAGAVALALSVTALADPITHTTFDPTTTNDNLFLNIVDGTTHVTYLFDTGISQATFSSNLTNASYSYATTLSAATDANYAAFLNQIGASDSLSWSLISTTKVSSSTGTAMFTGTSSSSPAKAVGTALNLALTAGNNYQTGANAVNAAGVKPIRCCYPARIPGITPPTDRASTPER